MTAFLMYRHTAAAHLQHSFVEVEVSPVQNHVVGAKGLVGVGPHHGVHLCTWVCVGLGGSVCARAFVRLHAVCRGMVASVWAWVRLCGWMCVCVCTIPSVLLLAQFSGETQCFQLYHCSVILATVYDWVCCMKWLLCLISYSSSPNCRMYASSPVTTKTCKSCLMREKGSLVRLQWVLMWGCIV